MSVDKTDKQSMKAVAGFFILVAFVSFIIYQCGNIMDNIQGRKQCIKDVHVECERKEHIPSECLALLCLKCNSKCDD